AQLDPALHNHVLAEGLAEAQRRVIAGKAVTPFLLDYFHRATGGASLRVNVQIIRNNARLAARLARALGPTPLAPSPHGKGERWSDSARDGPRPPFPRREGG
ncbi:MAG: pseudouridine-5'-phosphate glycosidase, partial [Chloroflexota bacterium]